MRTALLTNFHLKTGMGKYAFELYKNLKNKIEVDLIGPIGPDEVKGVREIKEPKLPFLSKTLNAYFYYPRITKSLDNYDIYHLTSEFITRAAKFKKPSVVTVTDIIFLKIGDSPFFTRYFLKKSLEHLKSAERIISISEYTKKDIIDFFDIDEKKIVVTLLGVDEIFKKRDKLKCRKSLDLPEDKRIILNVGSEEPRKNIPLLIKSFHKLQKNMDDLILIRVGEKRPEITALVRELGLENKVRHFSNVPEEKLALFYSASDLFVFPSYYEGFGLPPLEAMASGCPVITSNKTSLPEVVGDAGILIDPMDGDKLTEKMNEILTNDKIRNDLILSGLKRARKMTWKRTAKETLKVYEGVLK